MKTFYIYRIYIFAIMIVCSHLSMRADDGSWQIYAYPKTDSLTIKLVAKDTKQQLAVLMQGLYVTLPSQSITVAFPSAPMVKKKIKHHPNEVKAMMRKDSANVEVRPDLFPLVCALCDTTATITDNIQNDTIYTRSFKIELDKEKAILSFSLTIPLHPIPIDSVIVEVKSAPGSLSKRQEFSGKRLSIEDGPAHNGLGQASMGKDDKNRTVNFTRSIAICKEE